MSAASSDRIRTGRRARSSSIKVRTTGSRWAWRSLALISCGQVTEVSADRSKVTLAIDSSSHRLAPMLQDQHASGVVFGEWQAGGQMQLRYLDPATRSKKATSWLHRDRPHGVPKGLVIGKVERDPSKRSGGANSTVDVAPLINFNTMQSVMVITGDRTTVSASSRYRCAARRGRRCR